MSAPGLESTFNVGGATQSLADLPRELERGQHVGRYVIIRMLGRGGMGAVYAALDTKLDRQVALKLLHSAHDSAAVDRMIGEAKALARLDDPHVVQVFDAGEHDGQVYIAMQLVDGEDLATALTRRTSVAQKMSWFCAAGRGLAAAHAAGLVHRDFKPNNVLIDRRGRVAVTDFGLARSLEREPARPMTAAGTLMGTPAFMSPEQHGQLTATPASDQFSFCIALWQALYDRHPFVAGDASSLNNMSPLAIGFAIYYGELLPPPKTRAVPRRVQDALMRGLAHAPAQRWPSMDALLDELAPAQKRRRLWPYFVVAGVLAAGAGGGAVWLAQAADKPATCTTRTAEQVNAVWSPSQARQLQAVFAKSGRSYATTSAQQAGAVLDRYATRWQHLAADVCENERAGLSELVARRRVCLDARLDALRGLATMLVTEASGEFVDRARAMAEALPDLSDCIEERLPTVPPAAIAAEVTKLSAELSAAEARAIAGDYPRGREEATRVLDRAEKIGWEPLQAKANYVLGEVKLAQFDVKASREHFTKAAEISTALALDREAARAWREAQIAAGIENSAEGVATFAVVARASAQRTKDKELIALAELARARGLIHTHQWKAGVDACKAAYTGAQALDNKNVLEQARNCMIEALVPLGRTAEYEPILAQQIADRTRELGPEHPSVADLLKVQVDAELRAGRLGEARNLAERVLAIRSRVYPAKHIKLAEAYYELGGVADAEGKTNEALELYNKALAAADETRPEQVVLLAAIHTSVAMRENSIEGPAHHAKALQHFEHALAAVRKSSGPDSLEMAILLLNYGQIKSEDNVEASLGLLGEARSILEKHKDKRAAAVATAMAIVAYNAKRYEDARKFAEEALEGIDASSVPQQIAHTKSVLARSLWETGGDKKAARTMALDARARFAKLGPGEARSVKSLDAWLAKHH